MAENEKVKCNLCAHVLQVNEKSTELLNHMKMNHKEIYELQKSNPQENVGLEFVEVATETVVPADVYETIKTEKKDVEEILEQNINKKTEPLIPLHNWIWQYVTRVSKKIIKCKFCGKLFNNNGSTGYLSRHLRISHKMHTIKRVRSSYNVSKGSWICKYFDKPNENKTRCKLCSTVLPTDSVTNTNHMKNRHTHVYELEVAKALQRIIGNTGNAKTKENRPNEPKDLKKASDKAETDWIWKVFEKCDEGQYSCKICKYRRKKEANEESTVTVILSHLKRVHGVVSAKQIIVEKDSGKKLSKYP